MLFKCNDSLLFLLIVVWFSFLINLLFKWQGLWLILLTDVVVIKWLDLLLIIALNSLRRNVELVLIRKDRPLLWLLIMLFNQVIGRLELLRFLIDGLSSPDLMLIRLDRLNLGRRQYVFCT